MSKKMVCWMFVISLSLACCNTSNDGYISALEYQIVLLNTSIELIKREVELKDKNIAILEEHIEELTLIIHQYEDTVGAIRVVK